jgi:hypothetical protein
MTWVLVIVGGDLSVADSNSQKEVNYLTNKTLSKMIWNRMWIDDRIKDSGVLQIDWIC